MLLLLLENRQIAQYHCTFVWLYHLAVKQNNTSTNFKVSC